jgi:hypothetical protein
MALQASEKTPERLKISLLEFLNTNLSASDIIPFLMERIRNETNSDKARTCAVLCLHTKFRFVLLMVMVISGLLLINLPPRFRFGNEAKLQASNANCLQWHGVQLLSLLVRDRLFPNTTTTTTPHTPYLSTTQSVTLTLQRD